MAKLTHRYLESLTAANCGGKVREDGNLVGKVRAKSDGKISVAFYYRYRFGEKQKELACGTWPAEGLVKIRSTRDEARFKVSQGIDPGDEKKIQRHERDLKIAEVLKDINTKRADALTVQDLFDVWLVDGVRRQDGNAGLLRSFTADVLPKIGARPISDLTEHDLRGVLRALVARGVNRSAVATRNNLKQMFAWAEKRQPWRRLLADGDPMDLIDIEQIVSPDYDLNTLRDRVLSPDEIRELDAAFKRIRTEHEQQTNRRYGARPIESTTERAVWIMLSTMCRVGELSVARWANVNFEKAEWFIPRTDVKGRFGSLTIFLSAFALAQFRQLHALTGHSEWCFPSRLREDHIDVKSISKQIGDRQVAFKKSRDGGPRKPMMNRPHDNFLVLGGGKHGAWTPHDLRRTGATMMQALGVSLDVIDRCQNHVLAGSKIRRHYMHHEYADEKRRAWAMLGERLTEILTQNDAAAI
jgi:integrase